MQLQNAKPSGGDVISGIMAIYDKEEDNYIFIKK